MGPLLVLAGPPVDGFTTVIRPDRSWGAVPTNDGLTLDLACELAARVRAGGDLHEPGPLPPESEQIAGRRTVFSAAPPDAFPDSAAAARTMDEHIVTQQYLWGPRRILDGIAPGGG